VCVRRPRAAPALAILDRRASPHRLKLRVSAKVSCYLDVPQRWKATERLAFALADRAGTSGSGGSRAWKGIAQQCSGELAVGPPEIPDGKHGYTWTRAELEVFGILAPAADPRCHERLPRELAPGEELRAGPRGATCFVLSTEMRPPTSTTSAHQSCRCAEATQP
jgi:hypothetical protein